MALTPNTSNATLMANAIRALAMAIKVALEVFGVRAIGLRCG